MSPTGTSELRRALRTLAVQTPPARVPEDFFDRAVARRRQRIAMRVAAIAVLLLMLAGGFGARALLPAGPTEPVGSGGTDRVGIGLPSRLVLPPLRTAQVSQSAPGPAALIFGGAATTDDWNEGRFAVVAAGGDRYRVIDDMPYTPPGFEALLSPDGTLIARNRTVSSLVGDGTAISLPGNPLAFSPDGTHVVYERADGTDFDAAGRQRRPSIVGVYDLAARRDTVIIDNTDGWVTPGWSAAISPDNRRLALRLAGEIRLYDIGVSTPSPAPYATVSAPGWRLGGPGAWAPDGRSFVTAEPVTDNRWRLVRRSSETGQPSTDPTRAAFPEVADARYVRVVGWRPDGTAIALIGLPGPGAAPGPFETHAWSPFQDLGTVRVQVVALAPGTAALDVLLETPDGVSEVDVAVTVAIAGAIRPAGEPDYGPPHPTVVLIVGVSALIVGAPTAALVISLIRRGNRFRRPRATTGG